MLYAYALLTCFLMDFVSTNWTKAVVEHRLYRATILTGVYHTIGMTNVLLIVKHPWCVVPAVIGRMCGTLVALYIHKYPLNPDTKRK